MGKINEEIAEKQIKIEYVEKLRANKPLMKMYKFDTITAIENNLANEKYLNINTFLALCALENKNILYANQKNNTYFELKMNDTDKYIIYLKGATYTKRYGFELDVDGKGDKIKSEYYQLDNIHKPMKAISAYTVNELRTIAIKLGISFFGTNVNPTKKDLYETITKHFV
jgi:hypothetical protein